MKKIIKNIIFLSFIILLGMPSAANANAGTPLMWAALFHLAVGNAIIGVVEGVVIAKFFHLNMIKSIGLLMLANYASAWIGGFILHKGITDHLPLSLNNIRIWLAVMVFAAYTFTIVLELPFIALCFRGTSGWLHDSIKASFLAQTLTYLLLIVWYWMASGTSLLTSMHIVPLSDMRPPDQVLMYYISVKDGDVYLRHLSMQDDRKIFGLNSSDRNDRLFARPSQNAQQSDIVARLETGNHSNPLFTVVQSSLPVLAATEYRSTLTPPAYEGTWFNFGRVPLLDASESDSWEIWTGFWPVEGMEGTDKKTGKKFHFSLETPFAAWPVRNAVKLPDDKVLFQLGNDQICLLDIETNKIALVSKGRGPVPIIEKRR